MVFRVNRLKILMACLRSDSLKINWNIWAHCCIIKASKGRVLVAKDCNSVHIHKSASDVASRTDGSYLQRVIGLIFLEQSLKGLKI
jgi:hypothetical protein